MTDSPKNLIVVTKSLVRQIVEKTDASNTPGAERVGFMLQQAWWNVEQSRKDALKAMRQIAEDAAACSKDEWRVLSGSLFIDGKVSDLNQSRSAFKHSCELVSSLLHALVAMELIEDAIYNVEYEASFV